MNTPDEITHEGKILVRLSDINDAREGDWVMISSKMFPVNFEKRVESLYYYEYREFIQAAYREKKAEAYPWINSSELISITDEWANNYLTAEYGSPEALMRKGAEQAIQLTEDQWDDVRMYSEYLEYERLKDGGVYKALTHALANCRPKGGVK